MSAFFMEEIYRAKISHDLLDRKRKKHKNAMIKYDCLRIMQKRRDFLMA